MVQTSARLLALLSLLGTRGAWTGPELAAELGGGRILHRGRWFVAVRA